MKDADIQKLDQPKKNQPVEYYQKFLQHLDPMIGLFEIRLGYLRWLQGSALEEAISSRKVKHGQYGRLLKLLDMSKSTAFNCRKIAQKIPLVNARRFGYSAMMRICGLLNDSVDELDSVDDNDDKDFDLTLAENEDFDEGEKPLPSITYHNFLPKLENVRDTLEAISQMDYATESRDDAVKHYLSAQKAITQIKKHCLKVEKLLAKRISVNRKVRKSKSA